MSSSKSAPSVYDTKHCPLQMCRRLDRHSTDDLSTNLNGLPALAAKLYRLCHALQYRLLLPYGGVIAGKLRFSFYFNGNKKNYPSLK
jgi:hypothetical protein